MYELLHDFDVHALSRLLNRRIEPLSRLTRKSSALSDGSNLAVSVVCKNFYHDQDVHALSRVRASVSSDV